MYPIFFSVSSSEIDFANLVWAHFPDDWIYLYSKTGEDGADMWEEISRRELPKSKIFVVFWSRNYVVSKGCVREILQAKDLVKQGVLRPLIIRLDDFPISWKGNLDEAMKPVFEALGEMLSFRTSSHGASLQQAIDLLQRVSEPILKSNHPMLPRHDIQKTMREVVRKDQFTVVPTAWVSGFNGVGRETLIREFNRNFTPNGRGILIEVNEASLPKQALLRLESEAFGSDRQRLLALNAMLPTNEIAAIADAIERVFTGGDLPPGSSLSLM